MKQWSLFIFIYIGFLGEIDIHVNRNYYVQEIRIVLKKIKLRLKPRDWYLYSKIPSIQEVELHGTQSLVHSRILYLKQIEFSAEQDSLFE